VIFLTAKSQVEDEQLGFEVGPLGIATGGVVTLQVSPFWGWSTPQVELGDAPGYTTVRCSAADAVLEPQQDKPPTARDLVHRIPEALLPEDDLETALRLCEMNQEEHMPVVDNRQDRKVIGEVRYQDLVLAYNRALLAARAAERGES